MISEKERETSSFVVCFSAVLLIILGNVIVNFSYFDVMYLIVVLAFLVRYIYIKKEEKM